MRSWQPPKVSRVSSSWSPLQREGRHDPDQDELGRRRVDQGERGRRTSVSWERRGRTPRPARTCASAMPGALVVGLRRGRRGLRGRRRRAGRGRVATTTRDDQPHHDGHDDDGHHDPAVPPPSTRRRLEGDLLRRSRRRASHPAEPAPPGRVTSNVVASVRRRVATDPHVERRGVDDPVARRGVPVAQLGRPEREADAYATPPLPGVIRSKPFSSRTGRDAVPCRWWM